VGESSYIDSSTTIFWFRRDLRLDDNAGLYRALKENQNVLPLFIFDTEILEKLEDRADKRVEFIHQSLLQLKHQLEELGSSLLILHGNPFDIYKKLHPRAVYTNHDYEPYAKKRDEAIATVLKKNGSELRTFKDQVIFDRDEVLKDDGTPYTIFTPYSKKWKSKLDAFYLRSYRAEKYFKNLKKINPLPFPSLEKIGFNQATHHQKLPRASRFSSNTKYIALKYSFTIWNGEHSCVGPTSVEEK